MGGFTINFKRQKKIFAVSFIVYKENSIMRIWLL